MFLSKDERPSALYGETKPRWHIRNIFKSLDGFSQQLPGFNLKGRTQVTSVVGGTLTFLILLTTIAYANIKFIQLETGKNPNISSYMVDHFYSASDKL